jgi:hypothetical protein
MRFSTLVGCSDMYSRSEVFPDNPDVPARPPRMGLLVQLESKTSPAICRRRARHEWSLRRSAFTPRLHRKWRSGSLCRRRCPDDSAWLDHESETKSGATSGSLRQKGRPQPRSLRRECRDSCRLRWQHRLPCIRLDSRSRREACESNPAFPKSSHPQGVLSPCCSCRLLLCRCLEEVGVLAVAFFLKFVQWDETKRR